MSKLLSPAALLLAVIAGLLLFARPPLAPDLPQATTSALEPPAYDLETAMALAGQEVPADTEEYYFFALFEDPVPDDEIELLAAKLRDAAREHDFLGIAGPDAQRTRHSLLAALDADREQSLAGLTLIFVGPIEHRDEVTRAVRGAGAEIRYVSYPKYSPEV
jgi:hypothetical protein